MRFQQVFFLLAATVLILSMSVMADVDDNENEDDDEVTLLGIEAESWGSASLYLLVATVLIVGWKPTFRWLRVHGAERFDQEPREFKRKLGVFNRRFMRTHNWLGMSAVVIGTLHGIVLEWHWTLWVGLASLWLLVISGSLMQWKWPPKSFRRGGRLLHMQRTFTVVAIIMLLIGHQILD
ncbi:MAG: hypothetical protein P8Q98_03430 [Candidatus Poseidoniaceae archaeon]|nr:hypothetical protein [Candidatus Poseidoniaceae archaeon]